MVPAPTDEPDGAPEVARVPRPSHPKLSVEAAWKAWQADGQASAPAGAEFLSGVGSWTEGTAAQLLRQRWPAEVKRPTAADVRERLRHHLGLAARGSVSTSMEALDRARRAVVDELRKAQTPPQPRARAGAPTRVG